ncbi:MAG: ABC transporter permease, partial [Chloroflexi bacterium]
MRKSALLLALVALLLIWQLLAMALNQPILPSPVQVAAAFAREVPRGDLPRHFLASLWRVIASLALSIALAVPAGLVLGQSPRLNRLFSPFIYLTYPLPKVVLVPVVL